MEQYTNQEFTYRTSLAEEKGTITYSKLYGNTKAINQLVQNGNFASTTGWVGNQVTLNASGNKLTATVDNPSTSTSIRQTNKEAIGGHKYYCCVTITPSRANTGFRIIWGEKSTGNIEVGVKTKVASALWTFSETATSNFYIYFNRKSLAQIGDTFIVENAMIFDVTQIENATGLTFNSVEDFENYLKLLYGGIVPNYIPYSQNKLLDFGGLVDGEYVAQIKTTGKNLINVDNAIVGQNCTIGKDLPNSKLTITCSNTSTAIARINNYEIKAGTYRFSYTITRPRASANGGGIGIRDVNTNEWYYINANHTNDNVNFGFTIPQNTQVNIYIYGGNADVTLGDVWILNHIQIEKGNTATTFVPYEQQIKSIPSSILPLRQAGDSRDEYDCVSGLSTRRVGSVIIDNNSTSTGFAIDSNQVSAFYSVLNCEPFTDGANVDTKISSSYLKPISNSQANRGEAGVLRRANGSSQIRVSLGLDSGISTQQEFKNYMEAHPLVVNYPLASPTTSYIESDLTSLTDVGGTEEILPLGNTAPIYCDEDYRGMISVNVEDLPEGWGTTTGEGSYRYHSYCTLTATPTDDRYKFSRFEDENETTLSVNNPYTFKVE